LSNYYGGRRHVISFAAAGAAEEFIEGTDYVGTMNVVANLFRAIAEDRVRLSGHGALHQFG
jgi:hypothetical protein